jgi:hypothetical protein
VYSFSWDAHGFGSSACAAGASAHSKTAIADILKGRVPVGIIERIRVSNNAPMITYNGSELPPVDPLSFGAALNRAIVSSSSLGFFGFDFGGLRAQAPADTR